MAKCGCITNNTLNDICIIYMKLFYNHVTKIYNALYNVKLYKYIFILY